MAWRALNFLLLAIPCLQAYSVLTHEAVIDAAWETSIQPVLLHRFPAATAEELREAHAYAYGGAIIQDLGYYPFGNHLFSDLLHYVRSGDFVENLIHNAENLNEFAFALGALAHDAADSYGHPIGVNPSVALTYPKLRSRFGEKVAYEDKPSAHIKVEFGFDAVQVARGNYAPEAYRDFIGFKVSKPLLERAFLETYGIEMKDVFASVDLALTTYRFSVSQVIPEMTKVAWQIKKNEILAARPGLTQRKFVYNISRASFEKEWGREYQRPGLCARILAVLFRLIPKIGPFRALAFHPASPAAELLFMKSFNITLEHYRENLAAVRANRLRLANTNFDIGEPAKFGEYQLADAAWEKYLQKLDRDQAVSSGTVTSLKAFYGNRLPSDPEAASILTALLHPSAAEPAKGR